MGTVVHYVIKMVIRGFNLFVIQIHTMLYINVRIWSLLFLQIWKFLDMVFVVYVSGCS